jgi:hypothetical protein
VHDLQYDGLLDRYAVCDFYHDFLFFHTQQHFVLRL